MYNINPYVCIWYATRLLK